MEMSFSTRPQLVPLIVLSSADCERRSLSAFYFAGLHKYMANSIRGLSFHRQLQLILCVDQAAFARLFEGLSLQYKPAPSSPQH